MTKNGDIYLLIQMKNIQNGNQVKLLQDYEPPKHHIELIKNSAKIADIQNISQVYINLSDELDILPVNF